MGLMLPFEVSATDLIFTFTAAVLMSRKEYKYAADETEIDLIG